MKQLLIITQKVDDSDDLLGFFVAWIREFSLQYERVDVIALGVGAYELPRNVYVHSLGKERGASKFKQLFRLLKMLWKYTAFQGIIFAHMSPVFAIIAWPFALVRRSQIVLWYLHRSVTIKLKIAEKICYRIFTAAKESLQFTSDKIIEVGHGISVERFTALRSWTEGNEPLRILSVGRISPIKNYETLIEACRILKNRGIASSVTIVGRPIMPADTRYLESLKVKVKNCELESTVHFSGYVPYVQMPEYYKKADLVINLTPTGGVDKTVLEGMASGALILGSNLALRHLVLPYDAESLFRYGDAEDLAAHIQRISALSAEKKSEISKAFTETIRSKSDVTHVIERIQNTL